MTKEIEVRVAPEIESKNIEIGEWGLTIKNALSLDEWNKALLEVQKYDGKLQWYLGDLAVYGEAELNTWGEKYDGLVKQSGYEENTLRRYAVVARRFPQAFRESICGASSTNFGVTFSHFQEVAPLDNDVVAKHFLEMVRDSGWSRDRLRTEVTKYKHGGKLPEKAELPKGYKSFKEQIGKFFKGFVPEIENREYDEKTWLLEVRDTIDARLEELGVINE